MQTRSMKEREGPPLPDCLPCVRPWALLLLPCLLFGAFMFVYTSMGGSFNLTGKESWDMFAEGGVFNSLCLKVYIEMVVVGLFVMLPGLCWPKYPFHYGFGLMLILEAWRCLSGVAAMRGGGSEALKELKMFKGWFRDDGIVKAVENLFDSGQEGLLWWLAISQAILYFLYGIRVVVFLGYRQFFSLSYEKFKMKFGSKGKSLDTMHCRVIRSVGMALFAASFYLPLHLLQQNLHHHVFKNFEDISGSFTTRKGHETGWCCKWPGGIQLLGQLMALTALLVEQIADCQKLKYKEGMLRVRSRPGTKTGMITTGLYKYCQQPNYLAEGVFHFGLILGGLAGFGYNWRHWLLGAVGPIFMFWVLRNASITLRREQKIRYGGEKVYETYAGSTPTMLWNLLDVCADILVELKERWHKCTAGKSKRNT